MDGGEDTSSQGDSNYNTLGTSCQYLYFAVPTIMGYEYTLYSAQLDWDHGN